MAITLHHLKTHRLSIYLGLTMVAGLTLVGLSLLGLNGDPIVGEHTNIFIIFAILLFATELRPMPSLTDETELTASWAFAFTLLFIAPPAGAFLATGLAAFSGDMLNGKRFNRALFNAAQFSLSLAAGGLAGSLFTDLLSVANGEPVSIPWLLGVSVACVVGFSVNSIFISVAIALHQGLPILEMIRRSVGINLGMDGLLLALAPIFVVVGLNAVILVPLLLMTVWAIFKSAALALANKHEATHDQLTDIPNRRMFEDHASLVLVSAATAESLSALIHIDLDGFKGINDRLGHHYGDIVLKAIADRLDQSRRSIDHVARLGGDEFAIMLGQISSPADAEVIARRMLACIEEPLTVEGVPLAVSASLGVAIYPMHGEDVPSLLHHADMAMYQAKTAGSGVEVYSSDEKSAIVGRIGLLADLTSAIDSDQLSLVYQPKVDIETGAIRTVEALLRWQHPKHGLVKPGWFMPQAEQTDLMTPLTDHIMRMALSQCEIWQNQGIRVGVAINASARNLHDLRFPNRVADLLKEFHVDPGWFEIEITENTVLEDPVRATSVLGHLRALGVGLTIDDFGTGYSSLASLRHLTIDRIKVDRSFITDLATREGDLTIARSVIELGRNLGLKTVAEGVETPEVFQILRELGCDEIQGYLVSTPLPADELTPLLAAGYVDLDDLSAYERPVGPTLGVFSSSEQPS